MRRSGVRVQGLKAEGVENPLGIDIRIPRFGWILESARRGERQTAYRILAATNPGLLAEGRADLWDSGKVRGDRTTYVPYEGKPLRSRQRAFWTVRAWDRDGIPSPYSKPAWLEMGLLSPSDWKGDWIGYRIPPAKPGPRVDPSRARWIQGATELRDAQGGYAAFLRRRFQIPAGALVRRALLLAAGGPQYSIQVNAREAAGGRRECPDGRAVWEDGAGASVVDVTDLLEPGENVLSANLGAPKGVPAGAAGILARLAIELADGGKIDVSSDGTWRSAPAMPQGWAWREAGFDDSGWGPAAVTESKAKVRPMAAPAARPAAYLRKGFDLAKPVRGARIYATALGLYELRLNGIKVGDRHIAPEWTDYRKRLLYQTYDVTGLLRKGRSAIGAILADGWYAGHLGWSRANNHYGPDPLRLRLQLEIRFEDGSAETIASDRTWKGSDGPIRAADLLDGETVDARREMPGWDAPGFDDRRWRPVDAARRAPGIAARLEAQISSPVRVTETLNPVSVSEPAKRTFIFDLGRNLTGWARLRARGAAGRVVRLRFAEALKPDRTLYTANLRRARCSDRLILSGKGGDVLEPRFTFRGFRYVEVTGLSQRPKRSDLVALAASSDLPVTGRFECASAQGNALQRNIVASQRGNFLSVPTDCPQRDERLGWTGDVQVFARTASFNMDVSGFLGKWLADLRDAQGRDGAFPDVAPRIVLLENGAPGWGNAGVIVPWVLYRVYGDRRILEAHYGAMSRWVAYVAKGNPDGIWRNRTAFQFGDWLSVGETTPHELLATAFFARDADIMNRIARALGRRGDAARYAALFAKVRAAFAKAFLLPDGKLKADTQTAYALALRFGLLPEPLRPKAASHLAAAIRRNAGRLTTGFLGVSHLLPALTEAGETALAYSLWDRRDFPSWGYSIRHGATTIWERWDGWTAEKGFQDPAMNSFNHYAYGSVGEWMYATIAGIDLDPEVPAFKRILIRPRPGGGLAWVRAAYDSPHGRIECAWRASKGGFALDVRIPANATARIYVPAPAGAASVREGKTAASRSPGLRFLKMEGDAAVYESGSGRYRFRAPAPAKRGG